MTVMMMMMMIKQFTGSILLKRRKELPLHLNLCILEEIKINVILYIKCINDWQKLLLQDKSYQDVYYDVQ
jgi:hypothetical protein